MSIFIYHFQIKMINEDQKFRTAAIMEVMDLRSHTVSSEFKDLQFKGYILIPWQLTQGFLALGHPACCPELY